MSRSRAAMGTWASSLAFFAATMLTGFVITPWVLRHVGRERFGIARTLTETSAYLVLVAQGITVAIVPLLASSRGRNDHDAFHRTLGVGFRLYFAAALLFMAAGLALLPVLGPLLHVAPAGRPELRAAWLICLFGIWLTALAPMRTLLDIAHKGYVANLLLGFQGSRRPGSRWRSSPPGWASPG